MIEPSPFTDPPITLLPYLFDTGTDSPVSIDSLTDVSPSITSPSAGIFSPGLTRTLSPEFNSFKGTSLTLPSCMILWASEGISRANSSSALEAPITDFISIQCPRSIISISVASSQKNILPDNPKTTALLYRYATVIAIAIRVIMPGFDPLSSSYMPLRNGYPP